VYDRLRIIVVGRGADAVGQLCIYPRHTILCLISAIVTFPTPQVWRTLVALCGLLISTSGDCASVPGDLISCASSSISVVSVPLEALESTGEGSIWLGYGLAGGMRESLLGPEDLFGWVSWPEVIYYKWYKRWRSVPLVHAAEDSVRHR
jgi:hypothetical protein